MSEDRLMWHVLMMHKTEAVGGVSVADALLVSVLTNSPLAPEVAEGCQSYDTKTTDDHRRELSEISTDRGIGPVIGRTEVFEPHVPASNITWATPRKPKK